MAQNNGIEKTRLWFALFWLASAAALAGALVSQFVFNLHPCHLCLYQRLPYSAAILLLTPLFFYKLIPLERAKIIFLVLAVIFLINVGLAGYHAGVEQKWWAGPTDCTSGANPDTIEALTQAILNAETVRCDEPAFVFLGLSMAAWNMLYSLGLCGVALWRSRKN